MGRKVGIIGCGNVGSATAFSLVNQQAIEELVLVDCLKEKAEGDALDLQDATVTAPGVTNVYAGGLVDIKDADVIIISVAGPRPQKGETRLDELKATAPIIMEVVTTLKELGFSGCYVVATNPCDVITYHVWSLSGLPRERVIGTGTLLDSSRLRRVVANELKVKPHDVHAYMLGEHGDSQFALWSHSTIFGQKLEDYYQHEQSILDKEKIEKEVIKLGFEIYWLKGNTEFGIGNAIAQLTKAIVSNERAVFPVSTILQGEYGLHDVAISIPSVIGKGGIEKRIPLHLSLEEHRKLEYSANIIQTAISEIRSQKIQH
ncbi:L-lactate dehydrogenase [Priestia flexa]|uniref:L-lactate dehydrogenase n=1 Tax=Priestia flexa TaxID=86664 RepID=UPI00240DFC8F|nr:L-lactate dehydrogenase [Priestia flexa]WEZ06651.1 L-lactate dehydrogenase [Priestia flexa]